MCLGVWDVKKKTVLHFMQYCKSKSVEEKGKKCEPPFPATLYHGAVYVFVTSQGRVPLTIRGKGKALLTLYRSMVSG